MNETTKTTEPEKLNTWALVELMGHQRVVGKISEQPIAGTNMLRVDVPASDTEPAHTRYYGGGAIYAIHPIGEAEAQVLAKNARQEPAYAYTLKALSAPKPTDPCFECDKAEVDPYYDGGSHIS